ncbi:hypothetical protein SAMN04487770_1643, partial [Butyrivibrio sp. ob235]|uniref:hypothetical protein n=1 Tax=Butyrivibrio sp. ob235 TaxID=1761780 RepID=UPI0008D21DE9
GCAFAILKSPPKVLYYQYSILVYLFKLQSTSTVDVNDDENQNSADDSTTETDEAEESDSENPDEQNSESDNSEQENNDSGEIYITGSFDLDSVIDKNMNASKIIEVKEIVETGTNIYSASGKWCYFFYFNSDGSELGYRPEMTPNSVIGKLGTGMDEDGISAFSDEAETIITSTKRWRMNCYSSTDGECDVYVDMYVAE